MPFSYQAASSKEWYVYETIFDQGKFQKNEHDCSMKIMKCPGLSFGSHAVSYKTYYSDMKNLD